MYLIFTKYIKKIKYCFTSSWLIFSLSWNSPDIIPIFHKIGGLIRCFNPASKIPYVAKEDTANIYNIPKL